MQDTDGVWFSHTTDKVNEIDERHAEKWLGFDNTLHEEDGTDTDQPK